MPRRRQSVTMSVSVDLQTALWIESFQESRNYNRSQAMRVICDLARAHLQEMDSRKAEDAQVSNETQGFETKTKGSKTKAKSKPKTDLGKGVMYPRSG